MKTRRVPIPQDDGDASHVLSALKKVTKNLSKQSLSNVTRKLSQVGITQRQQSEQLAQKNNNLLEHDEKSIRSAGTAHSYSMSVRNRIIKGNGFPKVATPFYKGILPPQAPEHEGRLTVVLDMDETLLHSEFESQNNDYRQFEKREKAKRKPDFQLDIQFGLENGRTRPEKVSVHTRPGCMNFLKAINRDFECVVFTAALPVYARPVLDRLDPTGRLIQHRLYRDSTITWKGQPFVKDMALMGRDMRRVVLVDNNPCAMLARPDNAIPILSYYDSPLDQELPKILKLLYELKDTRDVRPYLKKRFRFRENIKHMLDDAF